MTAMTVAESIDLDEVESANLMGWLAERRLVRETGASEQEYCDPYTTGSIEATARGRSFADTGVVPAGDVGWPDALDRLSKLW